MNQLKMVLIAYLLCGVCLSPLVTEAAKRGTKTSPADVADVQRVLRAEVAGPIDRRAALANSRERLSGGAAAQWQAGFVRKNDAWTAFDASDLAADRAPVLDEYHSLRAIAPATFQGQLHLANWCLQHHLPDEERAHLHAALVTDSASATGDLLRRLGYRQVAGQWLNPEQLRAWQSTNRQAIDSIRKWEPKLKAIVTKMSRSPEKRDVSLVGIKGICEPAAIPAIEYLVAGIDENAGLGAIDVFRKVDTWEGTIALARQSVFSSWPKVRESAAAALKGRTYEHFVPELIGLLQTPLKFEVNAFQDQQIVPNCPVGTLYFNYVIFRETENQFQVAALHTWDFAVDDALDGYVAPPGTLNAFRNGTPLPDGEMKNVLIRDTRERLRIMRDRIRMREITIDELNERTQSLNGRVGAVLAGVSGEKPSSDPHVWWNWWDAVSDLQAPATKQVVRVDEYEAIGDPRAPLIKYTMSCFAAGTPVWTETGPVPIETIRVGDRVLAKDIESGELTYKPVIHTTVRPPKELTTLRLNDETIICTGGHRFWISGSGWVKARDLAPASLVHTATGNTPVWSAKKGQTAETYNLVVADFHTYFVGKTGVLCQDVLLPRPTNKVVPGLDRTQIAADVK